MESGKWNAILRSRGKKLLEGSMSVILNASEESALVLLTAYGLRLTAKTNADPSPSDPKRLEDDKP